MAGRAHDDHTCECDGSGACTLSVTLEFGHVVIPKERTGLKGELHLLGFNVPGSPGRSPGPTLRVCAGDTLKILLKNNMPPELVSTASSTKNGYHDFSVVNLCTRTGFTFPLWRRPTRSWRRPCAQTRRTPVRLPYSRRPYGRHALVPSPLARSGLDSRQLRRGLVLGVRVGSYSTQWRVTGLTPTRTRTNPNQGAAGMIIVEDAPNQLPPELEDVEDYIVATYSVNFADITEIANGYVQNCICGLETPAGFNCFGEPCTNLTEEDSLTVAQPFLATLGRPPHK